MFSLMPGPFVTDAMLDPSALGLEFLGGWVAVDDTTTNATVPMARAVEGILILVSISGMTLTTSTVGVRFNNDSGPNYWHRNFTSPNVGGLATFDNDQFASQPEINVYGPTGTDNARVYQIFIMNKPNTSHLVVWQTAIVAATGAVDGQVGRPNFGGGEWTTATADQVNSISLMALSGAFKEGTTIEVFGGDL